MNFTDILLEVEGGRRRMDEHEFRRVLDLLPVVRSRDYCIETDSSRQSTSRSFPDPIELDSSEQSTHRSLPAEAWYKAEPEEDSKEEATNQSINLEDVFWEKLKLAAEKKVGAAEAGRFCKAFQQVHRKLVYEGLTVDAARSFVNSPKLEGNKVMGL